VSKVAPRIRVEAKQLAHSAHAVVKVTFRVAVEHERSVEAGFQNASVTGTAQWQHGAVGLHVDSGREDVLTTTRETGIVDGRSGRILQHGFGVETSVQSVKCAVNSEV